MTNQTKRSTRLSQKINEREELYSYNNIIERAKQIEKEPTISELKGEINQIKSEIKFLKQKVDVLSV